MKPVRLLSIALAFVCAFAVTTHVYAQDSVAALYKSKCQSCHGADGKGDTAIGKKLGVRDFQAPEVAKMSDSVLFEVIKNGKGKMPAYKAKLADRQIKALIRYIHSLK